MKYSYKASKKDAIYERVNTEYDLNKLINMLSEGYDTFTITNESGDVVAEYPDIGSVNNKPKKKKPKLEVVEEAIEDHHADEAIELFTEEELNELAEAVVTEWEEQEISSEEPK